MPIAPPRVCSTCGHIDCKTHNRAAWTHGTPTPRIRGRKLQLLRGQLFAKHEYRCALCKQVTTELIRDHVKPLAEGGLDIEANTQALCRACSDAKTQQEATRGKRRA